MQLKLILVFLFGWTQIQAATTLFTESDSTSKYYVFYTNKNNVEFNPLTYFHPKAIERRIAQQLPLYTYSDIPVNSTYESAVAKLATQLKMSSNWLNMSVVFATPQQIEAIAELPFVGSTQKIEYAQQAQLCNDAKETDEDNNYELTDLQERQVSEFKPDTFNALNIHGKGVRIAIFDAGFPGVDKSVAFEHLFKNDQIKATFDFVSNNTKVFDNNHHGTMVLSNIAGFRHEKPMGLAYEADFLLARTERSLFEPYSEEENWLAAAEWADRNGADVINSSLGYTNTRYFRVDMDGKTSLVAKAANMAASKGILVVNSAGNDGSSKKKFYYVGTPADADSVLAIGGINPNDYLRIDFSSYGPTANYKPKPNVSAFGKTCVANQKGGYEVAYGTSFSSPLTAGFAACAKQLYPSIPVMELFGKIESSASLYPYFDYAHGYGIPQADKLLENTIPTTPTFEVVARADSNYHFKTTQKPNVEEYNYLYYHLADANGKLVFFKVYDVKEPEFILDLMGYTKGTIRLHYKGYTTSFDIK